MNEPFRARSPPQLYMTRSFTCSCSCSAEHEHECRTAPVISLIGQIKLHSQVDA